MELEATLDGVLGGVSKEVVFEQKLKERAKHLRV